MRAMFRLCARWRTEKQFRANTQHVELVSVCPVDENSHTCTHTL